MDIATGVAVGPSMQFLEASLTAIVFALAFCLPTLGRRRFSHVERVFFRLARRRSLSVAVVGLSALLLRLALLPVCPIPLPFSQDDFSFLLAANTFAAGRLANPTPAMWMHFESIFIDMKPTYMSMYFPAQGLVLAAGKVLFGHPWFGILCATSLMCAAICWMLQAWLPPGWALLGGMLAVLRIGLFSYWIDSYTGAGSIAALGGALLLGALPRFLRTARFRDAFPMALGLSILAISRPYEGLLLSLPSACVLGRWAFNGKRRPPALPLLRRVALPVALIAATLAWLAYYDYRAFGNPLTPPYAVNRATYAIAPYYVWQSPAPQPAYRHSAIRDVYIHGELDYSAKLHTLAGFFSETFVFKPLRAALFFAGFALLPSLVFLPRSLLDRRVRFLAVCAAIVFLGVLVETWLLPHYLATIAAALYALGLQSIRHMRQWMPGGQPVGAAIVRLSVALCVALAALRVCAAPLHLELGNLADGGWITEWYGSSRFGSERAQIQATLERLPGEQLAIVRYSPARRLFEEWVYNEPDIDRSKVVWAHDMGSRDNNELFRYYPGRQLWLVQPDRDPPTLIPYPVSDFTAGQTESTQRSLPGKKPVGTDTCAHTCAHAGIGVKSE